jgi:hypothetical protein
MIDAASGPALQSPDRLDPRAWDSQVSCRVRGIVLRFRCHDPRDGQLLIYGPLHGFSFGDPTARLNAVLIQEKCLFAGLWRPERVSYGRVSGLQPKYED